MRPVTAGAHICSPGQMLIEKGGGGGGREAWSTKSFHGAEASLGLLGSGLWVLLCPTGTSLGRP